MWKETTGTWYGSPRREPRQDPRSCNSTEDQAGSDGPSEHQSMEALAAALELKYRSTRIAAQILALGDVRLDDGTLGHTTIPSADADRTRWKAEGPALIDAVQNGDRGLIGILMRGSDRVTRTLALALSSAASRGDPPRQDGSDCQVGFGNISRLGRCDFLVPLPRAIRLGDVELVRLLLEYYGTGTNKGYQGVSDRDPAFADGYKDYEGLEEGSELDPVPAPSYRMARFHFHSGQVVQLAMELGYTEMVDLHIDYR
ncbi:hypothetical protein PG991_013133 [Apiospora marii]|uniref:Uncharacterized protein n=1 Tax=Apiospora marii TaxID=335849 RepID=A0ABR1R562_9PEZI